MVSDRQAKKQFTGDRFRKRGISDGKNRNREGFARIPTRIEHIDVDVVIVYSLDRLSRDMLTLLAFEQHIKAYVSELYSDGFSVADIAKLLNRKGYQTRTERK